MIARCTALRSRPSDSARDDSGPPSSIVASHPPSPTVTVAERPAEMRRVSSDFAICSSPPTSALRSAARFTVRFLVVAEASESRTARSCVAYDASCARTSVSSWRCCCCFARNGPSAIDRATVTRAKQLELVLAPDGSVARHSKRKVLSCRVGETKAYGMLHS